MKQSLLATIGICIVLALSFHLTASAQGYIFNQQTSSHSNLPLSNGGFAGSRAISQADVNGDGRLDFATIESFRPDCGLGPNYGCWYAQIYLSRSDGSFALAHSYLLPSNGIRYGSGGSVALADINADGKPDLIYTAIFAPNVHEPDWIVVQLGNGDGTFGTPISIASPASSPQRLFVGDFNGDGKPDVGYLDSQAPNIYIHMGNGNGSLQAASAYPVSGTPNDVVVADLNKDGKQDLAVAGGQGFLNVLLGNGDGTFATSASTPGMTFSGLTAADMNADGKVDLVVTGAMNQGGAVGLLLGNGDGTFGSPSITSLAGQNAGGTPAIGDFNDDGILDIATEGGWTGVAILLGNGNGSFKAPHVYGSQQIGFLPNLLVGDYNLDGELDLAALPYSYNGEAFSVLTNNGDGTFISSKEISAGDYPEDIVTGDFNRDGLPDVAVATSVNSQGTVAIYLNVGNGSMGSAVNYPVGRSPYGIVQADFNHDGFGDIATVNNGDSSVSILLGKGDGTFMPQMTYGVGPSPQAIALADLNGDGNIDLVIANYGANTVSVLLGKADGTFRPAYSANAGTWNTMMTVADFNRDGKTDVVVAQPNGLPWLLIGNGGGTFKTPVSISVPYGTYLKGIAAADTRGNGIADLLVADSSGGGTFLVYPGNGDATFKAPIYNYSGNLGTTMTFGDINGDGKLDVVLAGNNSSVGVALGNGNGTFRPAYQYSAPILADNRTVTGVAVADFNSDGSPDLAVTNYYYLRSGSGLLTLMLSNPVVAFSSSSVDFGKVPTGSSASSNLTLTNQSPTVLKMNSVNLIGSGADFTQRNDCGSSVPAFGSCTVTVFFRPGAKGGKTGWLLFNDSAVGKPRRIQVLGTGY